MKSNFKLLVFSTLTLFALFLAACSSSKVAEEDSPQILKKQILELQKAESADSAKIEELNNKILVLKDQVSGPAKPSSEPAPQKNLEEPETKIAPPEATQVNAMVPVAAPPKEEKNKSPLTAVEKLYRQVVIESKNKNLNEAAKAIALMLKNYKDSPLTNNGLFIYAETLYEQGNYVKSAEQFEKLYKLFPDGNKAVAALYKLALSYQKMGHPTEAQEAFENIVTVYPGSREALDAEKQIMSGTSNQRSGP